ncbi:hypothetical protein EYZ11_010584 [Aspergillus tanneri]|uniref:FAD/NAD(P)-binding domain-containing protein n=1 Tax=Aspergillus tanneri TaxID=1220188 RepID=A0A4S3J741_9EURO|nr:hypothetical protein EYZ11_010584 [Aspergillus tanneri]
MIRPKKVAIIGAGPSGLVAAKTLLHNFPEGTFSPTIFEKCRNVGGLWPTSNDYDRSVRSQRDRRGFIDPAMRTNLSRFTVGFSDLAWESVIEGSDVPMFPQAWQVGRYLEKYAELYVPREVLRFGRKVVGTVREKNVDSDVRWTVQWVSEGNIEDDGERLLENSDDQEVHSEQFDFLLVASGYFSRPSDLHDEEDMRRLLERSGSQGGKLVVIGGSMSGVETASALALHLSSMNFKPGSLAQPGRPYQVYHICSRPFWTVPYYLPHRTPQGHAHPDRVQILPLDLVFYDLARRPPGPVEYGFGPASPQQAIKLNQYFRSLLGSDYIDAGEKVYTMDKEQGEGIQPSWIGIGDDYAEFARSELIKTTIGRVSAVHAHEKDGVRIDIRLASGEAASLDNVICIVSATGFTPFSSLSFLPRDVLSTLEYSANDSFFPLVLDGKGSMHAQVPDLGFVGFYRGPYWGVMEMQARNVAERWFQFLSKKEVSLSAEEMEKRALERQAVREFRRAGSNVQFPMGDYVGLMETFAQDLGICRSSLREAEDWAGPVVPARYTNNGAEHRKNAETKSMMDSLRKTLFPSVSSPSLAMATATFRALHGTWKFVQTSTSSKEIVPGTTTFHPRYPSNLEYVKEYVCEEKTHGFTNTYTRTIYRLAGNDSSSHILIWQVDSTQDPNVASQFSHGFCISSTHASEESNVTFVVHATADVDDHGNGHEYVFHFDGVTISSWERTVFNKDGSSIRSIYTRHDS